MFKGILHVGFVVCDTVASSSGDIRIGMRVHDLLASCNDLLASVGDLLADTFEMLPDGNDLLAGG